ncbi:MAG: choice-of-anchor J domain-containing protein, partial [Pyrinomonadaceae bacterium]|nr:choice-of-anchor J domain-containing protein [Pyrinomonadaceae bacterium]
MFRSKKSLRAVVILSALIAVASFAVAAPLGGWGWLTQGAAAIGFPGMVSRIADDPAGRSVSDAGGIFTNDTGIGNAGLGSPELGQTLMPIGAQTGTFNGNIRGYFFTAPVNFNIVGLRVPTDQAGNQSIAVVRFNTPPPVFSMTTNDFTTLFLTQSNADPGILPVNIPVQTGDIIGVLGYRGTTNSYTNVNASTIFGQPVTLARLGMQFPLTTNVPHDLWSEPTSSNISRVELYYDDFVGGSTPTPTPTPPPATPTPTPPPASPSPTPTPGPSPSCTPTLITEGFDTITANVPGAGWFAQNNSAPVGSTTWFQGNSAVFPSHTGAPTSYIGGNFNSTAGAGTISTWLLTPQVTLQNGAQMTFWTRSTGSSFPDRLQVRMSTAGASTNVGTLATDVGDFTALMLDINPTYQTGAGGYPAVWTQQTITVTGVPVPTQGRFAFRYFVENGGPSGANSDYIGIDTFEYGVPCGPVPTPSPGVTPTPTPTPPPATPTPTPPPGCAGQSFPATTGMPASPPDNNPTGVTVDIPVSGLTGTLTVAQLRDWTWSNPHTWGGDIKMTLQAPSGGPTATIVERRGNTTCPPTGVGSSSDLVGPYNFGDAFAGNFHTVAGNPVPAGDYFASQCVTTPGEKVFLNTVFAGPVRPGGEERGLEAFEGMSPEAANGTWKLMMSDGAGGDTGTVSAVNLCIVAGGGGPSPTPTPPPATPTPSPNPSPSPTCVPGSGSLATSTVSNNGTGGVFLQLTPTSSALTVTSFDTQFGGAAGTPGNVEVWTRPGPYAGFTTSNVGWTLHETAAFTSAGTITNAPLVLTTPLNVPVGTTSIYLHSITTGNGIRYFGTGTTSTTTYNNADVTMFTDIARTGAVAFGGSQFTPRAFSGNVNYTTGGACPTPTPSPGVTPSPTPPPASPTPSPNPSPSVNPTPSPSPTCAPTSGVLHDNGGLATGTTTESGVSAPAGTQWSEVQHNTGSTTEANTSAGFS